MGDISFARISGLPVLLTAAHHGLLKDIFKQATNPLSHYFRDAVTKRYTRVIGNVFRVLLS